MRVRRITALGTGVGLVLGLTAVVSPPAMAAPYCKAEYTKNDWGSGFTTEVKITNLSGAAWTAWTLKYSYAGNQTLSGGGWGGKWSQSGKDITVANESWNGSVAAGASVSPAPGAQFTYSGTNANPTAFSVNGIACGDHQAPTATLTSPTAGATYNVGDPIPLAATVAAFDGATISKVEFYDNTTLLGTDTSAPYSFSWTNATAGAKSLYAKVYDSQGGVAESAPVGVTVAGAASVVVAPSTLTVPQSGTGNLAVKLSKAPTANVTVTTARTAGNTGLSVTAGATLTFTPSNWSTAQNVTISAAATGTGDATFTSTATGYAAATATVTQSPKAGVYEQRFLSLYDKIKNPANGYFSPQGVPYHSIETLIVEAPDYGHETTSEAYSYFIWLEAMYGKVSQNWAPFNASWAIMEKYMIPTHADQPTNSFYNPSKVATYASEHPLPSGYPSQIDSSVPAGSDPIASELKSAYGTDDIYGMHWIQDVDNKYGFGNATGTCEGGPTTAGPSNFNTFQRGEQESVWETIPQPTCDNFKYGGTNGFLDLFIKDSSYSKQWKFTDAPDADARVIQAAYWANTWAKAQNKAADVSTTVAKAGKMGDYLRYAMFDKYFKKIGNCYPATTCPAGSGKNSMHYLLSWYYAWGGANDTSAGWAWRIGSSHNHFGYQNPMAAYALTTDPALAPKSATAKADWSTSLSRQIELYQWLQSSEGAIAGGVTNSWGGSYSQPPAGLPKFYGMAYDWQPVYHDPPSNNWFGMQVWSMERVAEYYNVTGDAKAKALLDKWVPWALSKTTISATGWQIPATLNWSGQPGSDWNGGTGSPAANAGLHVTVTESGNDVGTTAAFAKTLSYYAAKSGDVPAKTAAKGLLDAMWNNGQDAQGIAVSETRADFNRFDDPVYVPPAYSGTMPNGDKINSSSTFLSLRSWYKQDPSWPKVQAYLDDPTKVPSFTYHRFWAQADIALAMADYGRLFGE